MRRSVKGSVGGTWCRPPPDSRRAPPDGYGRELVEHRVIGPLAWPGGSDRGAVLTLTAPAVGAVRAGACGDLLRSAGPAGLRGGRAAWFLAWILRRTLGPAGGGERSAGHGLVLRVRCGDGGACAAAGVVGGRPRRGPSRPAGRVPGGTGGASPGAGGRSAGRGGRPRPSSSTGGRDRGPGPGGGQRRRGLAGASARRAVAGGHRAA